MRIPLSLIVASSNPVRTEVDEEKLLGLSQSIKAHGLLVPIKVRPVDGKYEVVYGNRRLAACRLAGFAEVECIVEGCDDFTAFDQGLAENVARENMTPLEIGEALLSIKESTGWSNQEIGNRYGLHQSRVAQLIALAQEPDEIKEKVSKSSNITELHVRQIRQGLDLDVSTKSKLLDKVEREGLSSEQIRKVAEAVSVTRDPRMREVLLNVPYKSYSHDPEIAADRAKMYGRHDPLAFRVRESSDRRWQETPEVKVFLDYFRESRDIRTKEFLKMVKIGKVAPEWKPAIISKIRQMINAWQTVINEMEVEK